MDATIMIATFGDDKWKVLGQEKRKHLEIKFPDMPVNHIHGDTLHTCRNLLAAYASTEWLCFVDADDDLDEDYFEAMSKGTGDLLAPRVLWIEDDMPSVPVSLEDRDMEVSNQCVIGTLIKKELFEDIGGFQDWRAWEDWALFLSAYRKGARIEHIHDAVYIAYVNSNSRNNTVDNPRQLWLDIKAAS